MIEIVEAEADDLAGPRHRQRVFEPRQRTAGIGLGDLGEIGERGEVALGPAQHFAEVARQHAVHRLQIDHAVALDQAQPQSAVRFEPDDLHLALPQRMHASARPARPGAQGLEHFRAGVKYCRRGHALGVMRGQPGPAFGRPGCKLDPRIHRFAETMDCRVKPGNDDAEIAARATARYPAARTGGSSLSSKAWIEK